MRTILSLSIASLFAASAFGQIPGGVLPGGTTGGGLSGGFGGSGGVGGYGGYGGFGGYGAYNGGLSPFLNLRNRNFNPAVNYYNFVRPYTEDNLGGPYGSPFVGGMSPRIGSRFFPNQIPSYADDEVIRQHVSEKDKPDANGLRPVEMPPAGHGGGFMNTMGHFGSPNGLGGATRPAASLGRPRGR